MYFLVTESRVTTCMPRCLSVVNLKSASEFLPKTLMVDIFYTLIVM